MKNKKQNKLAEAIRLAKNGIFVILAIELLVYLGFSFTYWEWVKMDWQLARGAFAVMNGLFWLMIGLCSLEDSDEKSLTSNK